MISPLLHTCPDTVYELHFSYLSISIFRLTCISIYAFSTPKSESHSVFFMIIDLIVSQQRFIFGCDVASISSTVVINIFSYTHVIHMGYFWAILPAGLPIKCITSVTILSATKVNVLICLWWPEFPVFNSKTLFFICKMRIQYFRLDQK